MSELFEGGGGKKMNLFGCFRWVRLATCAALGWGIRENEHHPSRSAPAVHVMGWSCVPMGQGMVSLTPLMSSTKGLRGSGQSAGETQKIDPCSPIYIYIMPLMESVSTPPPLAR